MDAFAQKIIVTVLDKGLLALVVVAAGYSFHALLQRRKARDALLTANAGSRVEAYRALWRLTEQVKFADRGAITAEEQRKLDDDLVQWYYLNAGAMFLSWEAARRFTEARAALWHEQNASDAVRQAFSLLRTELKYDCGVYSAQDKDKQLPPVQDHGTRSRGDSSPSSLVRSLTARFGLESKVPPTNGSSGRSRRARRSPPRREMVHYGGPRRNSWNSTP